MNSNVWPPLCSSGNASSWSRQGRGGADQARWGSALHGARGDGADGHGGFGRCSGGRRHPSADGEDGADGALAPAEVLDAVRDLLSQEHGRRGRGGGAVALRGTVEQGWVAALGIGAGEAPEVARCPGGVDPIARGRVLALAAQGGGAATLRQLHRRRGQEVTRKPHRAGSGLALGERPIRLFNPAQAPGVRPALVSHALGLV